jgi:hypothetical protein
MHWPSTSCWASAMRRRSAPPPRPAAEPRPELDGSPRSRRSACASTRGSANSSIASGVATARSAVNWSCWACSSWPSIGSAGRAGAAARRPRRADADDADDDGAEPNSSMKSGPVGRRDPGGALSGADGPGDRGSRSTSLGASQALAGACDGDDVAADAAAGLKGTCRACGRLCCWWPPCRGKEPPPPSDSMAARPAGALWRAARGQTCSSAVRSGGQVGRGPERVCARGLRYRAGKGLVL